MGYLKIPWRSPLTWLHASHVGVFTWSHDVFHMTSGRPGWCFHMTSWRSHVGVPNQSCEWNSFLSRTLSFPIICMAVDHASQNALLLLHDIYQGQSLVGIFQLFFSANYFSSQSFPTSLHFLYFAGHHDNVIADWQLMAHANQSFWHGQKVL